MKYKQLALFGLGMIVSGCGVSNNLSVSTTNGRCANGQTGAPYCLSVTIQNNGGGQNFISSTNFPISNLSVALSGASNVISPATNKSMDPSGCTSNNLNPGSSCTFYLQLSGQDYPVESLENITVTMNYTIQNTLFGGSTNNYSTSFGIQQATNLYIPQTTAYMYTLNGSGFNPIGIIESENFANSIATDTSTYGFVYLAGNLGIYQYGGIESSTSSISPSPLTGANNLFTSSGNLYATGLNSATGVWKYSLSGESFTGTPQYSANSVFSANVNTLSPSSIIYLALNNSGSIYACSNSNGSSNCIPEGKNVPSSPVTSIGFLQSLTAPYTGLFVGTPNGVYLESGTIGTTTATWVSESTISAYVNALTNDDDNNLYAGDVNGNIWQITQESPTVPTKLGTISGGEITNMIVDINADPEILYVIALNISTYRLYSCILESASCTPTNLGNLGGTAIAGLAIGSSLYGL